jgi:DHA1 family multidrug resistance protein-like MFS transporter
VKIDGNSIYSFAVYVGSSIYSPTVPEVMEVFDVSSVVASLGLALYVLAYGIGPMLFAPLSE